MKDILSSLNPAQKEAVLTTDGPLMVIAGAGSGKTRVLTYRIAYLLQQGVDPFSVLSLTFTNKAAKEMKERIANMVGESQAKSIWMGTFHSVFARILRSEASKLGYPSNFTIYDTQDSQNVIKKVIESLQLDKDIYKPKQIQSRISQFKNNLVTVKAYMNNLELQEADAASLKPKMGEIYKNYTLQCFKNGAMDFDDLLLKTNELFTIYPEVLAKYQQRFKYILVDEYQDTNHSQYLIVKALASRYENICVVGDDAQSIYSFRGANIQNILNFQQDYPDAKAIALEQNYRSTQNIVNAANQIISHNVEQLEKKVWTSNDLGNKIHVYEALSDADEAQYVVGSIFDEKMNHHKKNSDFAILYRTNAQSRAFEDALRRRNIPYRVYGGLSFYQRKEIKDVVAYLRVMINSKDNEALLRIINYPARGIGNTTINKLIIAADKNDIAIYTLLQQIDQYLADVQLNGPTIQKLQDFVIMIESFKVMLKTEDADEVVNQLVRKTGIIKKIQEDDSPEAISRIDNIQEFVNSIKGFIEEQSQLEDGDTSMGFFLENIALATDQDNDKDGDTDKVSLMTVHLSKGLEFSHVFVVGLEENLFPSMMSMNTRQELEEERRLFYVALTRSQSNASFSYALSRYRWGKIMDGEPSRFLDEIDSDFLEYERNSSSQSYNTSGLQKDLFDTPKINTEKVIPIRKYPQPNLKPISSARIGKGDQGGVQIDLKVGDEVSHDRFGKGVVLELSGDVHDAKAKIDFKNAGEKNLLLKFAKLKIIS